MHERAAAILEAIKALPAEERTAFTRLFHDWEGASGEVAQQEAGTEWPDFAGRMKAIFGERVSPAILKISGTKNAAGDLSCKPTLIRAFYCRYTFLTVML